jgi:rhodanese-related sulfurtransferase
VNKILFLFIILTSCKDESLKIDLKKAKDLIFSSQENIIVLDVRSKQEWAETGIIKKSVLKNPYDKDFFLFVEKLDRKKTYFVICHSGGRSSRVAYKMKQMNFNVFDVADGIVGWIKEDYPLVVYQDIKSLGKKVARSLKKELSYNLKQAFMRGGNLHAIKYCNINAMSITSSLAKKYNVKIKRVSDKARNSLNIAKGEELKYIKLFKARLKNNVTIGAMMNKEGTSMYIPIVTNNQCLKCHGDRKQDLTKDVLEKIKQLYPKDRALGYKVNELRGIFHISTLK